LQRAVSVPTSPRRIANSIEGKITDFGWWPSSSIPLGSPGARSFAVLSSPEILQRRLGPQVPPKYRQTRPLRVQRCSELPSGQLSSRQRVIVPCYLYRVTIYREPNTISEIGYAAATGLVKTATTSRRDLSILRDLLTGGIFVVSRARGAYDARLKGPNRKFRFTTQIQTGDFR
jgi:hypothetical protein